jgi:hypothetical protein
LFGGILLGSAGFADDASAATGYIVQSDCNGTGGVPSWANTSNQITVEIYVNEGWVLMSGAGAHSNCANEKSFSIVFSGFPVTKVRVTTNGSDAYWIDDISLYGFNSAIGGTVSLIKTWGIDNNSGYCVSTDPADVEAQCYQAVAKTTWVFDV